MRAFIINRNRVTLPAIMAEWLAAHDIEVTFIDNGSDYPPLLDYYDSCGHTVLLMPENYGHRVVWDTDIIRDLLSGERYIVTDPDLDLSGVPDDFLSVMNEGLDRYPTFDKCGLSLEIEDLPFSSEGHFIRQREARYWKTPLSAKYYEAPTDTTFALYRQGVVSYSHSAIRTARPYTARHVPWYYLSFDELPEDEKYYFRTANESSSGKKRLML